jgi:hypothetical protein
VPELLLLVKHDCPVCYLVLPALDAAGVRVLSQSDAADTAAQAARLGLARVPELDEELETSERFDPDAVPALFLLDELFHGTNSHDRLIAAGGVLRSLIDRGAIGLMTTHDLALTAIADDLAPRALNMHFQDLFEEDGITFDYRARPGPVTRSNALALLRSLGLEIAVPTARDGRH